MHDIHSPPHPVFDSNAIAPGLFDNGMIRCIETQISADALDAGRDGPDSSVPLQRYGTSEVAQFTLF